MCKRRLVAHMPFDRETRMGKVIIQRDAMLMETDSHGSKKFPIGFYRTDTYDYIDHQESVHWHTEFQFISVVKNRINCQIGQSEILLREGEGLFINSGMLHGFTADSPCLMKEIIFHPEMIDAERSDLFVEYVKPFLEQDISHLRLSCERKNDVRMMQLVRQCVDLSEEKGLFWKIHVKRNILELWELLCREKGRCEMIGQTGLTRGMLARFRQMTEYIAEHYQETITLADIAGAAGIGKSEANRCFLQMTQLPPVTWLIRYRLRKAAHLLEMTEDPIGEIAAAAGFEDSSYFSRSFKKELGCSPREFRRRLR